MLVEDKIYIGKGDNPCYLLLNQANRHGMIAGASGTGKTVTMKVLAESFSQAGVPVFLADAKGDVRGMCQPGVASEKLQARIEAFGIEGWELQGCPCRFWNMHQGDAIPVRCTISEMGPTLLSRMLDLTEVQEGVMNLVFRVADDRQLLLIDIKDLRALLTYVAEHSKEYEITYGKVSTQSVGAILRALIALEDQGGDIFFGEPSLDLNDWFACDDEGRGYVNVLDAAKLIQSPKVYAMFLLWMLNELFEVLPEVGDLDKPKFVFFFDEAHLLFNGMPKDLLAKIVQVVKLIRSKGVGIYFISQSPSDIPDEVLAQLSNKIQHGLRAYTPAEMKAVKTAAQAFRANPAFSSEEAIMELATGEALISCLDADGRPCIVEKAKVPPSQCLMAAPDDAYVQIVRVDQYDMMEKYGLAVDPESAFEVLQEEAAHAAEEKAAAEEAEREAKAKAEEEREAAREERKSSKKSSEFEKSVNKVATSVMGQVGREVSRQLVRGLFNSLKK